MENNIDNADNFLLKRNDIIGEPSYPERMFWSELLVEYGKLLQSDVIVSLPKECLSCGLVYTSNVPKGCTQCGHQLWQ